MRSTGDSPVKYNAFNRELQLWVASCIYYGSLDAFTRMHGPLPSEKRWCMLRAGARIGTTLQVPQDSGTTRRRSSGPTGTRALLASEIDERVGDYLRGLLRMDILPAPLDRAFGPLHQWLNTGFIPEPVRDQLGLPWKDGTSAGTTGCCGSSARSPAPSPTCSGCSR